jgi:hypothetical protein
MLLLLRCWFFQDVLLSTGNAAEFSIPIALFNAGA